MRAIKALGALLHYPQEELIAILFLQMYPFRDWEVQQEFENIIYRY